MSNNMVIVAIPEQTDEVWKISSEKIPHMTLLFLGDAGQVENVNSILGFVEHAAALLPPFYMEMDYRGVLGPDEADVIFFEKGWDFKQIAQFREQLLANKAIKSAYNSTTQYDEWTPHLTLGYPATPAKETDRSIYSIRFDRIAVWTGDFSGPEFRLKHPDMADNAYPSLSMSAEDAEALYHYGVKGMHWGVVRKTASDVRTYRKNFKVAAKDARAADKAEKKAVKAAAPPKPSKVQGAAAKAYVTGVKAHNSRLGVAVRDNSFKKRAQSPQFQQKVMQTGGKAYSATDRKRINAKPEYASLKGLKGNLPALTKEKRTLKKKYITEHQDALLKHVNEAAQAYGTNASKTKMYKVDDSRVLNLQTFRYSLVNVQHDDSTSLTFEIKYDADGYISDVSPMVDSVLKQGEEFVDGLMHYGVKGMKWGHRKDSSGSSDRALQPTPGGFKGRVEAVRNFRSSKPTPAPKPVVAMPGHTAKGKAAVKTEGGTHQPAHPDAIKAATTKQQLHASGIKSLSNKELQDLASRLDLEARVNRLEPPQHTFTQKAVAKIMNDPVKTLNETNKAVENGKKLVKLAKAKKVAAAVAA